MTTEKEISYLERVVHASKSNIKSLKANRWTDENYRDGNKKTELENDILLQQSCLLEARKKLAKLYNEILNNAN